MNSEGFPQLKPDARKNASNGRVSGCSCAHGQNAAPPTSATSADHGEPARCGREPARIEVAGGDHGNRESQASVSEQQ